MIARLRLLISLSCLLSICRFFVSRSNGMYVNTFGTNKIEEEKIINKIKEKFDLTPNGIIKYLDLQKPIFAKTTNYGHLGKDYLPWEKIIKM